MILNAPPFVRWGVIDLMCYEDFKISNALGVPADNHSYAGRVHK